MSLIPTFRAATRMVAGLLIFSGLLGTAGAARSVRAIFVQPPDDNHPKAVLAMEGHIAEIELPQRNFSPEVELPAGELILAILAEKPTEGVPINPLAQRVRIPENWTRCLLLFIPDPANKVFPAKVVPINASSGDFPIGQTMIYNVTDAMLAAKLGSELVKVNPRSVAVVKAPASGFDSYEVAIDCAFPGDAKPAALCRSTWQHDPEARQILFVTPSPGQKLPRVWGILDRQAPENP